MSRHRVVITGIGLICSLGHERQGVIEKLGNQQHGFRVLPEFAEFKESRVSVGAPIPDFDASSYYPEDWTCPYPTPLRREELKAMNPHTYYAYHATIQAMEEAGLTAAELGEETGLFTASAGSPRNQFHNFKAMHTYGIGRTNPYGIVNAVVGTLSFNLASILQIRGSSCGFASACSSSAHALGFAADQIACGRQERIIVSGAEDGDLLAVLPFAGMHALSTAADPDVACLPFDRRRGGFVGSGGAATLMLESLDSAERRGAPILGEILGWGQATDGHKPAMPHPEGVGLARTMQLALKDAGVAAESVQYINAHATGTPLGDIAEAKAIHSVFGKSVERIPVSSTKALTGHTLSMAGALEVALSLLALNEGFTPGTANLLEPDPKCGDLLLPRENLDHSADIFLSNSAGFGGSNVCLVLRRWAKHS